MSSNNRKKLPKNRRPLTKADLTRKGVKIVEPDLESKLLFDFCSSPTPKRSLNISRCYRILYRYVHPTSMRVEYHDAVMPEHRNPTGLSSSRVDDYSISNSGHVCNEMCCTNLVRLVPVGCEDVLDKIASWWSLNLKSMGYNYDSIIIEQDSYAAQRDILASGFTPAFIYDYIQFTVSAMPIKEYVENGTKVWAFV